MVCSSKMGLGSTYFGLYSSTAYCLLVYPSLSCVTTMNHTSTAVGTGSGPADSVGFKPVAQTERESQHQQTSSSIDDEEQGGDSDSSALCLGQTMTVTVTVTMTTMAVTRMTTTMMMKPTMAMLLMGYSMSNVWTPPRTKDKSVFSRRLRCCG